MPFQDSSYLISCDFFCSTNGCHHHHRRLYICCCLKRHRCALLLLVYLRMEKVFLVNFCSTFGKVFADFIQTLYLEMFPIKRFSFPARALFLFVCTLIHHHESCAISLIAERTVTFSINIFDK